MTTSVESRCRRKIAELFNGLPNTIWIPNRNDGLGYISGRPDGEVRLPNGRYVDVECKGAVGSLFLGNPLAVDCTAGWHFHQRRFWQHQPPNSPYFIAALVGASRTEEPRFDFASARLFIVPPETWLCLESKIYPRKTCALSPELERIIAHRSITLNTEWNQYCLTYAGGQFHIPESHPLYSLVHRSYHEQENH